jgi:hypothetical protein
MAEIVHNKYLKSKRKEKGTSNIEHGVPNVERRELNKKQEVLNKR